METILESQWAHNAPSLITIAFQFNYMWVDGTMCVLVGWFVDDDGREKKDEAGGWKVRM